MSSIVYAFGGRRSIRRYKSQDVPIELIKTLLETASYAPSAHNAQPWRFIILTDAEQKNALADAMAQAWLEELEKEHVPKNSRWAVVNRSVQRFTTAPVLIVACLTLEDMQKYPDVERQNIERDLAVQSLGAAIQTLVLATYAEGLGSCWYCAPNFCKPAVQDALWIPENIEPQAVITLGYADEEPKTPERNPVDAYVYIERWGTPP
jgi:coenzyme F420-0:L-glutamate ligase / coenzyme F420-1:gamma-L-glutamate ligase